MDSTSVNQEITRAPEYLGFISEIVSHLAWPVTVLILAILLRKRLGDLLSSITRLKFRDFELEMDFKRLAESVERLPVAEAPRQLMSEPNLDVLHFIRKTGYGCRNTCTVCCYSPCLDRCRNGDGLRCEQNVNLTGPTFNAILRTHAGLLAKVCRASERSGKLD